MSVRNGVINVAGVQIQQRGYECPCRRTRQQSTPPQASSLLDSASRDTWLWSRFDCRTNVRVSADHRPPTSPTNTTNRVPTSSVRSFRLRATAKDAPSTRAVPSQCSGENEGGIATHRRTMGSHLRWSPICVHPWRPAQPDPSLSTTARWWQPWRLLPGTRVWPRSRWRISVFPEPPLSRAQLDDVQRNRENGHNDSDARGERGEARRMRQRRPFQPWAKWSLFVLGKAFPPTVCGTCTQPAMRPHVANCAWPLAQTRRHRGWEVASHSQDSSHVGGSLSDKFEEKLDSSWMNFLFVCRTLQWCNKIVRTSCFGRKFVRFKWLKIDLWQMFHWIFWPNTFKIMTHLGQRSYRRIVFLFHVMQLKSFVFNPNGHQIQPHNLELEKMKLYESTSNIVPHIRLVPHHMKSLLTDELFGNTAIEIIFSSRDTKNTLKIIQFDVVCGSSSLTKQWWHKITTFHPFRA